MSNPYVLAHFKISPDAPKDKTVVVRNTYPTAKGDGTLMMLLDLSHGRSQGSTDDKVLATKIIAISEGVAAEFVEVVELFEAADAATS